VRGRQTRAPAPFDLWLANDPFFRFCLLSFATECVPCRACVSAPLRCQGERASFWPRAPPAAPQRPAVTRRQTRNRSRRRRCRQPRRCWTPSPRTRPRRAAPSAQRPWRLAIPPESRQRPPSRPGIEACALDELPRPHPSQIPTTRRCPHRCRRTRCWRSRCCYPVPARSTRHASGDWPSTAGSWLADGTALSPPSWRPLGPRPARPAALQPRPHRPRRLTARWRRQQRQRRWQLLAAAPRDCQRYPVAWSSAPPPAQRLTEPQECSLQSAGAAAARVALPAPQTLCVPRRAAPSPDRHCCCCCCCCGGAWPLGEACWTECPLRRRFRRCCNPPRRPARPLHQAPLERSAIRPPPLCRQWRPCFCRSTRRPSWRPRPLPLCDAPRLPLRPRRRRPLAPCSPES